MRKDMRQIVSEPSRGGSRYYSNLPNEYRGAKRFKPVYVEVTDEDSIYDQYEVVDEFCERVLPMRARAIGWDGKSSQIKVGIIKRWLFKQINRPWDDVYSEVCKVFHQNKKSTRKKSYDLTSWLDNLVDTRTYLDEDGTIRVLSNWGESCRPLAASTASVTLYVDHAGILRKAEPTVRSYRSARRDERKATAEAQKANRKIISRTVQYHRVDGVWNKIKLDELPEAVQERLHSAATYFYWMTPYQQQKLLEKREVSDKVGPVRSNHELFERYGDYLWAIDKRLASKAEILRHKLGK